jgi:hypothetical protein
MPDTTKMFGRDDDDSSTTSNKMSVSEHDDDIEQEDTTNDGLNNEAVTRRGIDGANDPFVLVKTSRNCGFGSKDPLFNGVYLYEGTMTTEQVKKYDDKFCTVDPCKNTNRLINNNHHMSNSNRSLERSRVSLRASIRNIFSSNNN